MPAETPESLLAIAVDNLKDSCMDLMVIAADPKHLNRESREMQAVREQIANRTILCFALKNAVSDVRRLPRQPA